MISNTGFDDVAPQHAQPRECIGLVDAYEARPVPETNRFTWWDYRAGNFHKNLGLRIDLLLVSESLAPGLHSCGIDRDLRKGQKPSDHAPLFAELD